jgi:hypothetical protein
MKTETFTEVVKTLTRPVIALAFMGAFIAAIFTGRDVPDWFRNLGVAAIGWYFVERTVQKIVGQPSLPSLAPLAPAAPIVGAIVLLGLALTLAAAGALMPAGRANAAGLRGDADCTGTVDALDALAVIQYSAGLSMPSCIGNADASGDGRVNPIDALLILQLDAGLIGVLP